MKLINKQSLFWKSRIFRETEILYNQLTKFKRDDIIQVMTHHGFYWKFIKYKTKFLNYDRLKELKIISISLYKILSVSISYQTNNDLSPLDLEVSYQFKKIVYKLESNKIISVNKACELLGVLESEYYKEDYNNWYKYNNWFKQC